MPLLHLPPNHAARRIGEDIQSTLATAQGQAITAEFANASRFGERVCSDLHLDLRLPEAWRTTPVTSVSDLPFSNLLSTWSEILRHNGVPATAISTSAGTLAHRSQLLRAFSDPDGVIAWASGKVSEVAAGFPRTAADIECGRNPGDVLDPYILAATQALLYAGDFQQSIGATVSHKALMILEGLMGHMHEEVLARMRGNVRNPEPRGENQELYDPNLNPFPGADIIQPPMAGGEPLKLHQVKSKTGTLNSSGGARLAEQMRQLRMRYTGAEIYSHSLVGNTLRGHRSMGGMLRLEPQLIVIVGEASFRVLTRSTSGAELLLRLYQNAFQLSADQTGYSIAEMAEEITATFQDQARAEGEEFLEALLHRATRGAELYQDSRTYPRGRSRQ